MRLLLAALPAAACAAAMFLCFRMMRHPDMPADGHAESDDLASLRKEVADLREELGSGAVGPVRGGGGRWHATDRPARVV